MYKVPFLSTVYCDLLLAESKLIPYTVNAEEIPALRTDECVLAETCPQLGRALVELMHGSLAHVLRLVHGCAPVDVGSVHLTRYAANGSFQGVWHNDQDSDQTVVVELDPSTHSGGRTMFMDGPLSTSVAPVLAKGEALVLPGKTTLHAGVPLERGVRNILVYWMETKACE
jgi:hypothetical protein